MGIMPKVVEVKNLSVGTEKKWQADVELIRIKDGAVIGFGSAICSNVEAKKKGFDEYAVLSMAQTRAIGKAYRNSIGWVMKLAGYEATPKEEMVKAGDREVINVNAPIEAQEVGLWEETGDIVKLLQGFGFKTTATQLAAIGRLTGIKLKDWKMKKSEARTILAALLKKKHG